MKSISIYNFLQGLIILMQSLNIISTKSVPFWVDKELSIYTIYLFIILAMFMIFSSVGLFLKKHFGVVFTLTASAILISYGIITCFYASIRGVSNIASVPFITLTQAIIFIYIFNKRSIFKKQKTQV